MEIEPEVIGCMNDIIKKVVQREYGRRNYQKNKEKKLAQKKEHYQINKQKILLQQKEYYQENKQKILQKSKEYYQEKGKQNCQKPERIKVRRIYDWKKLGVICDNWDALYDHYLKTSYCDFCRCELTYDKQSTSTTKCLDHDHSITDRPNFRNILCQSCNVKRK